MGSYGLGFREFRELRVLGVRFLGAWGGGGGLAVLGLGVRVWHLGGGGGLGTFKFARGFELGFQDFPGLSPEP